MVYDLWLMVEGFWLMVYGLGFGVEDLPFRAWVKGPGLRFQSLVFRVEDFEIRV